MEAPGNGAAYGAFIASELDDLRALKASLEQRALAVVTTSGILVTLLFGLASVVTSRKNYTLPAAARPALVAALAAFVVAAALALIVNFPFKYRASSAEDLERIRKDRDLWREADWISARRIAGTRIEMIASYKKRNKAKAFLLMTSIAVEVSAILALAIAVAIIVEHG